MDYENKPPTFHGHIAPDYPGGACSGCEPDDERAVGWMAVVGGSIYNFKTPLEVVKVLQRLLKQSFDLGRQAEQDSLRHKQGL